MVVISTLKKKKSDLVSNLQMDDRVSPGFRRLTRDYFEQRILVTINIYISIARLCMRKCFVRGQSSACYVEYK